MCNVPSLVFIVLILEIWIPAKAAPGVDRLVGLHGSEQNVQFVEVRRSPQKPGLRLTDVPTADDMPKAHGLRSSSTPKSRTIVSNRRRASPTSTRVDATGASVPLVIAPMTPNIFAFPNLLPLPSHSPTPQLTFPGLGFPPAPAGPQMMGSQLLSSSSVLQPVTPIPTLSPTPAPTFTFPTLSTLIPLPTFPPLTLPPSFDQMASGYLQPKKKKRKIRRKATTTESSIQDENGSSEQANVTPENQNNDPELLFSLKSTNKKPTSTNNKNKKSEWMVPYYGENDDNHSNK